MPRVPDFLRLRAKPKRPFASIGIVVVVAGAGVAKDTDDISTHDKLLQRLLEDLSVKKAAALASDITGVKKNALYQRLLELQAD